MHSNDVNPTKLGKEDILRHTCSAILDLGFASHGTSRDLLRPTPYTSLRLVNLLS